jgi:hypothetical protein
MGARTPALLAIMFASLSAANEFAPLTAAEVFSQWRKAIVNSTSSILCTPSGGLGNTMTSVISAGVLALYFNKPIYCPSCPHFIYHVPACSESQRGEVSRVPDIPDLYHPEFTRDDPRCFEMWFFAPDHMLVHGQIGVWLFSVFGPYAMYYIGNYFFSVPSDVKSQVDETLAKIPKNFVSIGIHVRTHFHTVPAYMTDADRGCALIAKFIQARWRHRPIQVALAADSPSIASTLQQHIPVILQTGVSGFPDGDTRSAVVDFVMLQECAENVLTYRSTFSLMVAALANKTAYWYADEWPHLVRFACSQIGLASGIYQSNEPFNDKSNTRFHVMDKHERALRLYNRYYLV